LEDFYDVIKDIVVPDYIKNNAKKVNMPSDLVMDSAHLRKALLDPKYTQTGTWLDQPSPSQWFVVFPDNISDTGASISIVDEMPHVPASRSFIDKTNFQNFINLA
jgi:hypothetical protein